MFKGDATGVLVAIDVSTRGIYVDGVPLLVRIDAPTDHKDYLHGAGEADFFVTLATSKQNTLVVGLTSRAEVHSKFVDVFPHHAESVFITGSKEPTGIAYIALVEPKPDFGGPSRRPSPAEDHGRRRPR